VSLSLHFYSKKVYEIASYKRVSDCAGITGSSK
jgi:hypothetical protein